MGTTAQKLAALAEVKADIADAITAKGGTVPTKFADYGDAIMALPGGSNKLPSVADKTVTSLTASDLAGATKIGNYAFGNCSSLTSVEIPSTVTLIDNRAFAYCPLATMTIPVSVTTIALGAFHGVSTTPTVTFQGRTKAQVEAMSDYPWFYGTYIATDETWTVS